MTFNPSPAALIRAKMATELGRAVNAAGGQSAFGRLVGKRQSTVRGWLVDKRPCPAELVLVVERALEGFSRHKLRPDIYPLDDGFGTHNGADIAFNGTPVESSGMGATA